jgi:mono/diheme cytochrome c family protein
MRPLCHSLLAATLLLALGIPQNSGGHAGASDSAAPSVTLRTTRSSPSDLELGGDLAGLAPGTTRYISRDDLLALPQKAYAVSDDSNFTGPTRIGGVPLKELGRRLGAAPEADLIVAICHDQYRANYSRAYIALHHPLLVLTIDGKPPAGPPKGAEGHRSDMGPYMISHPSFTSTFKILSGEDEPQIPWGVVRIEFRDEDAVFRAIRPPRPQAAEPTVQAGYRIAQQNCFRCHNMGREGGQKSGHSWLVLSAWAAASPDYFAAYVRDPRTRNPRAQMPGNPGYDDATIRALTAYFRTFSPTVNGKQEKEKP